MKKSYYILGIVLVNFLLAGVIFKINHFAGANILLTVSLLALSLIYLPIALIRSYRLHRNQSELHLYWIAGITIAINFIGILFKLQHWPGASWLLFIGVPLPFVLFLPFYIRYHNRKNAPSDKNFFGVVFFMVYMGIFTSLLALDYSKDVYNTHLQQVENRTDYSKVLESRNDIRFNMLLNSIEDTGKLKLLRQIHSESNQLYTLLDDSKKELIIMSGQRIGDIYNNGDINYNEIKKLNVKGNSITLSGSHSENELFKSLECLEETINLFVPDTTLEKEELTALLSVIEDELGESKIASRALVENLSIISLLQQNLRLVEYQVLYN